MNERIKVSYEQIKKANDEIEKTKIGTKGYAQVNERIKAFRKVYPTGSIETEIEEVREDYVRIRTSIYDENERLLAVGRASETNKGNNKINQTSMIENCETSAVGRALGMCGFGIDTSVASAEEVQNAMANQGDQQEEKKLTKKATPKQVEKVQELVSDIPKMLEYYKIEKVEDLTIEQASEIIAKKGNK